MALKIRRCQFQARLNCGDFAQNDGLDIDPSEPHSNKLGEFDIGSREFGLQPQPEKFQEQHEENYRYNNDYDQKCHSDNF
jgi:hypothetical protein